MKQQKNDSKKSKNAILSSGCEAENNELSILRNSADAELEKLIDEARTIRKLYHYHP